MLSYLFITIKNKNLQKYLFLLAICILNSSFTIRTENHTKSHIIQSDEMYVYFRVINTITSPATYYFSNVVLISSSGFTYINNLYKKKEKFQTILKRDYELQWPISNITSYEYRDSDMAEEDRKKRISHVGDNLKYIDF